MGYLIIIENLIKKCMIGMKFVIVSEVFQVKKKVVLKCIVCDFEDQELVFKFDKFKVDVLELVI